MKKALVFTVLILACASASAQVNEVIDSLFARLEERGLRTNQVQESNPYGWEVNYNMNRSVQNAPKGIVDSLWCIETICDYLNVLCRKADFSRRFEMHDAGVDTVMYAICLTGTKLMECNVYGGYPYFDPHTSGAETEDVTFMYAHRNGCHNVALNYHHNLPQHDLIMGAIFDPEPLKAVVGEAMRRLNVKGHGFVWKYYDDTDRADFLLNEPRFVYKSLSEKPDRVLSGEVRGTIYSVPRENKAYADYVLQSLRYDIRSFLNDLSWEHYILELGTRFKDGHTAICDRLFHAYTHKKVISNDIVTYEPQNSYHDIYLLSDELGYHIIEFDVVDALRIPHEPSRLKSIDGNKKAYAE